MKGDRKKERERKEDKDKEKDTGEDGDNNESSKSDLEKWRIKVRRAGLFTEQEE